MNHMTSIAAPTTGDESQAMASPSHRFAVVGKTMVTLGSGGDHTKTTPASEADAHATEH